MMELGCVVNLTVITVLNVLFFFSGICLNSLVIISFWRSAQLRKKLCYFMIMVLSCCDLLAVVTNHSFVAGIAVLWLTGNLDGFSSWVTISRLLNVFLAFSLFALLVLGSERYLAAYYPVYHRLSVTKGKLLAVFLTLIAFEICLIVLSINDLVISTQVGTLIFLAVVSPPMLFTNFKLLLLTTRARKRREISLRVKQRNSLKNVSGCLLALACLLLLSITVVVYAVLSGTSKGLSISDDAKLAGLWAKTTTTMNSTCNCLIFYWKNRILRTEGKKVIESMKMWRGHRTEH